MKCILGNEMKPVSSEDIPQMKYTERVIKETLRIFPVAPVISRYVKSDVDLGKNYIKLSTGHLKKNSLKVILLYRKIQR